MELLLGSKSPRRQELLKGAELKYRLVNIDCEESHPADMNPKEVAGYLAIKKSKAFSELNEGQVLLTADTIVYLDEQILNKPMDEEDARNMLKQLSNKMHTVYTGVCLRSLQKMVSFTESTEVYFKRLSDEQINYYVLTHKPLDKAGAYGIQDWIGYTGILQIKGDFFNVMGLPIQRVYDELSKF